MMPEKDVHDFYRYYRDRASLLISGIIVFSSGVLAFIVKEKFLEHLDSGWHKLLFYFLIILPLFFAIILGVLSQRYFYKGYKLLAEWSFSKYQSSSGVSSLCEQLWQSHNSKMKFAEKLTDSMIWLFLVAVCSILIFFSLIFFEYLK